MPIVADGKKFRCTLPKVGADDIDVQIGNLSSSNFKPHIVLPRWLGQKKLSVEFPTTRTNSPTLSNGVLTWDGGNTYSVRLYGIAPGSQNELGGFEFEIILKRKPPTNKIALNLPDMSGMTFYYQSALTPEEIADGCIRPENVVGSYAVYAANHSIWYTGQSEANLKRCGKLFHIYRPQATDAIGKKTWGNLSLNSGQLTVEIDQVWLNTATYPVTIDPAFGNEHAGATGQSLEDWILGNVVAGAAGTGTSISAYVRDSDTYHQCKFALYAGDGSAIITNGGTNIQNPIGSTGWKTQNFTSAPTLTAVNYCVVAWANAASGDASLGYDDDVTYSRAYKSSTYGAWPAGLSIGAPLRYYSVYCTYSVATAGKRLDRAFAVMVN